MIGIIYGSTFVQAKQKLDEMIQYWRTMKENIEYIFKDKQDYKVVLHNNDTWIAVSITDDNVYERLYNIALIDKQISQQDIEEKILPSGKAQPYTAIGYY